MNGLIVLTVHEWRRLFLSPLAWTCLAVVQLIAGGVFWLLLAEYASAGSPDGRIGVAESVGGGLFGFMTIVLLLVVPLLTMRSFAEERQSGSLELLLAAPLSATALVLGKFFGLMGFFLVMLALLALMPASLAIGTPLDFGLLAAGLLGLTLMTAAFVAAGIFVSTLTAQPLIAAMLGFGLLLGLWLLELLATADHALAPLAGYLSLLGHFDSLRRGLFDSADIAYYLLFCTAFLGLAVQRFGWEREA